MIRQRGYIPYLLTTGGCGRVSAALGGREHPQVRGSWVLDARHGVEVLLRAALLRGSSFSSRGPSRAGGGARPPPARLSGLLHSARGMF